ncbi:Hypothetical protein CINCED_3A025919 [Cinara cedri]|uniref:Uncharacterized protein n=1 Tax=Cinara cedri TaxID=506608 RepID=A0A5E4M5G9_9HEMI|nr:Hypothetical protein CINCED_3A025919 [Cinara cedri]
MKYPKKPSNGETAGNTALRGYEGKSTATNMNEGNFIRSVRLVTEFDPII